MHEDRSTRPPALSPEQRTVLAKRLLDGLRGQPDRERIPRRQATGPAALSFAQQRLWFLDRLVPGNPFYNLYTVHRFQAPVNPAVLERSLNAILRRHEVLRTRFMLIQGEPVQVVVEDCGVRLSVFDLRHLPSQTRETEAQRIAQAEAERPFDLSEAPLLRASLVQTGDAESILLLNIHHIVADGWSMQVLFRELTEHYEASARGRVPFLPELSIQYADYALWQRQWLQGETLQRQLDYWKRQLAGLSVLHLPTDRPRVNLQSFRGTYTMVGWGADLTAKLKGFCRTQGVTLFMLLLAGFKALLARHSGQHDIVVGSPIAGRDEAQLANLIGFFVNTLVLRTDLSGGPTFDELLRRVQRTALEAYAHQDLPFEILVEKLHPERDLSRNPLFQVMFQVLHAPPAAAAGSRISSEPPVQIRSDTAKFDLTCSWWDLGETLTAAVEYNTDLFDGATIQRLIACYEVLMTAAVDAPATPVRDLPLLTAAERRLLLHTWNATRTDYPSSECIHERFQRIAHEMPDVIAADYDGETITYAALNRRANQLAHFLRRRGVQQGDLVGLCVQRSVRMLVGMLGILKAGAAYVPIDPVLPWRRVELLLADADAALLLAERAVLDRLELPGVDALDIDGDWPAVGDESDADPALPLTAEHLAYVMYTSGSTGAPKGITIPHRAVMRLVCDSNYVAIDASDRIAQAANASFDAATFEIWGALLHGARVVGLSKDVSMAPLELAERIAQHRISTLFITTALFNELAQGDPGVFRGVRHVLFGGEAVNPHWVRCVLDGGAPDRLLHVYGPTESTTFATWWQVDAVDEQAPTVPIGRPLANTRAYVLDGHMQPVAIGVPGELYLGGDGLAHGYLKRPALTAERFVPDPFSNVAGARLYRSGDWVRYRSDGAIEFLARRDRQIKLRGFRVELDEIEAALKTHAAVRDALVIAREEAAGDRRLVAYVATRGDAAATVQLREFLRERMPDFMIPAHFVLLENFPLTANGKIDRAALPIPDAERPLAPEGAAETELEEAIAALWKHSLNVDSVGVDENFFDLGGHSLLLVQMQARIRSELGRELPMLDLFRFPTVRSLAAHLVQKDAGPRREEVASGMGSVEPSPETQPTGRLQQARERAYKQRMAMGAGRARDRRGPMWTSGSSAPDVRRKP